MVMTMITAIDNHQHNNNIPHMHRPWGSPCRAQEVRLWPWQRRPVVGGLHMHPWWVWKRARAPGPAQRADSRSGRVLHHPCPPVVAHNCYGGRHLVLVHHMPAAGVAQRWRSWRVRGHHGPWMVVAQGRRHWPSLLRGPCRVGKMG